MTMCSTSTYPPRLVRVREEEFVAVGIVYPSRLISPAHRRAGNRTRRELALEGEEPLRRQFDEEAPFVGAAGVLAEDDLAVAPTDLADVSRALIGMPVLLEAEGVEIEAEGAIEVGDEEDRSRVPAMAAGGRASVAAHIGGPPLPSRIPVGR